MRLPATLSAAILLSLASPVLATPVLYFQNTSTDDHQIIFGVDRFSVEAPFEENSWPDPSLFTAGHLAISSGPLRDVNIIDEFQTRYRYRPGTLRLDLSWTTPTGSTAAGWLTARVPSLDVLIQERDPTLLEFQCCDYPRSLDAYVLTRGRLSPSLAALLGVSPHAEGGTLDWWLENIPGTPPPFADRVAYHIVEEQLRVAVVTKPVPEPTVLQLVVTVLAPITVSLWRRRRRTDQ